MEIKKRGSNRILGHVFALFSVIVWGSCYVLTKNLLNAGFTALQITPIRMALAYVVLLIGLSSCVIASFVMAKIYSRIKLIALSFIVSLPALICALMILIKNDFS